MSSPKSLIIQSDAAAALTALRRAVGDVLEQIPGDNRRPTDLQKTLNIDYKLCWQLINIARTDDVLAVSQFVPGVVPIKKFLTAAAACGVADNLVEDVHLAMKEFMEVVDVHSGDRQAFDSMVASISGGDAAASAALQHRRAAFRSESQIWGLQVGTHLRQLVVRRSADGSGLDTCFINAKYGLRRLRHEVSPIVHGFRDLARPLQSPSRYEPLDPAAAVKFGAPVLAEFCSEPIPSFRTIQHLDGWVYSALNVEQIGRKSTINLVFGGVGRKMPSDRDENGEPQVRCGAAFIAPTELGVVEILAHRPSFGPLLPTIDIFATAAGCDVPEAMRRNQQFLVYEELQTMGSADQIPAVPEVRHYLSQLRYTFDRLGWNPREFDVFRLRLPYPILHTTARIIFADTNHSEPNNWEI